MKRFVTAVLICMALAGTSIAADIACVPPNLSCPQCIVTCPEIPPCPDCTVNCADSVAALPGLWQVVVRGVQRCGQIAVYQNGWIFTDVDGSTFYKFNEMGRAAKMVESCP